VAESDGIQLNLPPTAPSLPPKFPAFPYPELQDVIAALLPRVLEVLCPFCAGFPSRSVSVASVLYMILCAPVTARHSRIGLLVPMHMRTN
jgi:hypothetical protein